MTLKQKFQNEIETESTASLNMGDVLSWGVLIFGEGHVRIVVVLTVRTNQTSAHIARRDVTTTEDSLVIRPRFAGLLHASFERAGDGQGQHSSTREPQSGTL